MNYMDFIIILIAVIGALYGLIKGVIRQLGSLGGFIAGVVVSRLFGNSVALWFQEIFDLPEGISRTIAYSLVFLVVYIVCVQLMRLIRSITHHVALGWLDRLCGAAFGAVKYVFIMSILLNFVHIVDPNGKLLPGGVLSSSQYYQYTLKVAPAIFSVAQEQFTRETKATAQLFIPYSDGDSARGYCEK